MWRDEIYERAPDFKVKVANARFRSSEWRFLAALDGRRSAGDIARELRIDDAAAEKFLDAQEAAGAIVPSLLSFEEFERVAGPLDDVESNADSSSRNGKAAIAFEPPNADCEPSATPSHAPASSPASVSAGAAKIDASVGAAFETLRKLRERAPVAEAPATEPAEARIDLPPVLDATQASIVEALVTESPAPERAIVHESATVIPLASMVERVGKSPGERLDAETAAWNAVLERMRGDVPRERTSNDSDVPPSDDAAPPEPPNVRRLPFGKRPPA